MKRESMLVSVLAGALLSSSAHIVSAAEAPAPATPAELVTAYDALADTILAANKAERKLVLSILATGYAHARAELGRARHALEAGDAAGTRAALENLATAVGQLGTEGDNAVAGIRKRLLEGGHHANAEGEAQGLYDDGYVIVTRTAKQAFLDASRALAQLARAPKAVALDAEWQKVEAAWAKHVASAK
jgi:hypothetical protein